MQTLFTNIKELLQVREASVAFVAGADMNILPTIKNAFLLVDAGRIAAFGPMESCPTLAGKEVVDARGKMLLPSWCDSHTHLVYAGNREEEFKDRINGLSYEEIARKGGGILNSAKTLQATSAESLYQQSKVRLEEVMRLGTGALEIKSGYGLSPEAELKMLRVIKRLKEETSIPIKATFLAAHALPEAYKSNKAGFLHKMLDEVLPVLKAEDLASAIDVFCETGYFTAEDTAEVLQAAQAYGLVPKIHVNQFNAIGGVAVGVQYNARSVDHLEVLTDADVAVLQGSKTMPVALPGCSFFLGIPYTPARKIIAAGLPLALASDYNPGSAPSGNMNFIVSTACIQMNMTPEEAINAATINGAYAMGLEEEVGSITVGKKAHLILTKALSSYTVLPYAFGSSNIEAVYINGKLL
ncbi:imidazolonepropionase [Flavobacteriaceae bacterium]|nr:imidazolonepropionase [Flavobacteriaceae bacterium]